MRISKDELAFSIVSPGEESIKAALRTLLANDLITGWHIHESDVASTVYEVILWDTRYAFSSSEVVAFLIGKGLPSVATA